ncbi:hypothetical protein [Pseudomonas sp. RW10S2]|uniref:hypothetical protein n=1 Tax=Pseudomonas sp. RW10S2 TaxID=459637 RepID=UPI001648478D|nr:hypothetical protein [Pseudomonas sp. RW10S2]MBC3468620.1 hypothetical protein [Pseudomonas sp. RW10S2]
MMSHLSSNPVLVQPIDLAQGGRFLTEFEVDLHTTTPKSPIADYTAVLRQLREEVKSVATFRDEIEFGKRFRDRLNQLAARHQLPDTHFSIDTSGDPLIVREGDGEHLVSPTHFENGAYFSHPHADHQLRWTADRLPHIQIGRYVRFGRNCSVNAGGDVKIGDYAWLSPGSQLLRQDHDPYGRPSVAARTVAMTRLPAVTIEPYAWIGREAMIGWNADYLGKASIVAARTFLNGWVGDYSVTGDRGKVLQYLPYKAYLFEINKFAFIDSLRVTDWAEIDSEWRGLYALRAKDHRDKATLPDGIINGKNVLVVAPDTPNFVNSLSAQSIDVIGRDRDICADILQLCVERRKYNLRYRGDLTATRLPFPTAGTEHYRRDIGYDAVVSFDETHDPSLLYEIYRVTKHGGQILTREEDFDRLVSALTDRGHAGGTTVSGTVEIGGIRYLQLQKPSDG